MLHEDFETQERTPKLGATHHREPSRRHAVAESR
jgi:hypothetical protein